jgi:signal transduction histidine kinase
MTGRGWAGLALVHRGDMFRSLRPYQLAVDVCIALVFFVLGASIRTGGSAGPVLVVVVALALVFRRLSPAIALVVAWLGALAQMYLFAVEPALFDFAILAVLYSTAAYGRPAIKWAGLASVGAGALLGSAFLVFGTYGAVGSADIGPVAYQFVVHVAAMLILLGLPWTIGLLVRTRTEAQASRQAQLVAEREAEKAERDVIVEQERNRIARDMHDVVAHSLAVVIAQADGARYARAADPEAVDRTLLTISATAREALADVRILLGQLRHEQSAGPQPALVDIPILLDQLRASGLRIIETTHGAPLPLGIGAQLAVFRIVQEAFTNVLRHGNTAKDTTMRFAWTATGLEVTITSALLADAPAVHSRRGHGISGMQERASLVGGSFSAGPADGVFRVTASIPGTGAAVSA